MVKTTGKGKRRVSWQTDHTSLSIKSVLRAVGWLQSMKKKGGLGGGLVAGLTEEEKTWMVTKYNPTRKESSSLQAKKHSSTTSTQPSWVKIWNTDMTAYKRIEEGKLISRRLDSLSLDVHIKTIFSSFKICYLFEMKDYDYITDIKWNKN